MKSAEEIRINLTWTRKIPVNGWILAIGLLLVIGFQSLGAGWIWLSPSASVRDQDALQGFVGTLAEVLAGVLGFTVSVVAIVVQLSADRFTPKVTELFLRERTNFIIVSFLILANLISVWTTLVFSYIAEPLALVVLNLVLGTLAFVLLIPYFIFVFNFLTPTSIIDKIEQQIRQSVIQAFSSAHVQAQIQSAHDQCLSALDEIKGIATSAIRQRESPIMLDALDSLKAFALFYATYKHKLPPYWFLLTQPIIRDPDFVSVDTMKLRQIETQQIWLELKIFRQYQAIFTDSLNEFREACYVIAINTREITERGLSMNKPDLVDLGIKFFNTYLRAVLNTRDVRTGYNILKQYRMVAEHALEYYKDAVTLEIAQYFRYYSLIAYKAGLFFLSETFAFDLGLLAQTCCKRQSDISGEVLQILLKIDQDPESEQQENTLRGIRKSQVKLAAYYLKNGFERLAYLIYKDMQDEPQTRLNIIRDELHLTRSDFWEFTDRGENFYYVEPDLEPYIGIFFEWFTKPPIHLDNFLATTQLEFPGP